MCCHVFSKSILDKEKIIFSLVTFVILIVIQVSGRNSYVTNTFFEFLLLTTSFAHNLFSSFFESGVKFSLRTFSFLFAQSFRALDIFSAREERTQRQISPVEDKTSFASSLLLSLMMFYLNEGERLDRKVRGLVL